MPFTLFNQIFLIHFFQLQTQLVIAFVNILAIVANFVPPPKDAEADASHLSYAPDFVSKNFLKYFVR